jgi:hypothetical protein
MLLDLIRRLLEPRDAHPMAVTAPQEQQEWLVLYQLAVEDIRFFKDQQWKISNYAILLYAAIVTISQIVKPLTYSERCVLTILTLIIAACTTWILISLQSSINNARKEHTEASKYFKPDIRTTVAQLQQLSLKTPAITWFLIIAVWLSGAIAVWLIAFRLT